MMRRHPSVRISFVAALAVAFAALLVPHSALAQNVSKTTMAGPYSVTLKVLPAEGFEGANSPMVHDSGARPETVHGPMHPNHHMVAFIKKNGKPVEHAHVKIWYRMTSGGMMGNHGMANEHHGMMNENHGMTNNNHSMMGEKNGAGMGKMKGMDKWWKLPVARMHVRGKGAATTHFGNNVRLMPGSYEAKVSVNGHVAMFHFSL